MLVYTGPRANISEWADSRALACPSPEALKQEAGNCQSLLLLQRGPASSESRWALRPTPGFIDSRMESNSIPSSNRKESESSLLMELCPHVQPMALFLPSLLGQTAGAPPLHNGVSWSGLLCPNGQFESKNNLFGMVKKIGSLGGTQSEGRGT